MAIYRVNFISMNVTEVDDGWFDNILEPTFTFMVNGSSQMFQKDMGTGVHDIGLSFPVDVPTAQSQIIVSASGVEDDLFWGDPLPGFTTIWGENLNWGEGTQMISKSDSNITYNLTYEIVLVPEVVDVVPMQVLYYYASIVANLRGKRHKSEKHSLAWSINRLSRSGWHLVQIRDDEAIFKGAGPLLKEIEQRFDKEKNDAGEKRRRSKK